MVSIPPGTFTMGSPASEPARFEDEDPHQVTITRGFCMGQYEVTQAEYSNVMGVLPSVNWGETTLPLPVLGVTWNDAVGYCAALSDREQAAGRLPMGWRYRLPTEAEWEYACRAGIPTARWWGDEWNAAYANADLKHKGTTEVDRFPPNPWGSHDMIGNVWEWCDDVHDAKVYSQRSGVTSDPLVTSGSEYRVLRGGSWGNSQRYVRAAIRDSFSPGDRNLIGFRVVGGARQDSSASF